MKPEATTPAALRNEAAPTEGISNAEAPDTRGPSEPPNAPRPTFQLDGVAVPFEEGQSILAAALAAGHYVPYLCYHPDFAPHGSCKVCTVRMNGHTHASCTQPARAGDVVVSNDDELNEARKNLVQFLFTEGNHFCPSCEASGRCTLQALGHRTPASCWSGTGASCASSACARARSSTARACLRCRGAGSRST